MCYCQVIVRRVVMCVCLYVSPEGGMAARMYVDLVHAATAGAAAAAAGLSCATSERTHNELSLLNLTSYLKLSNDVIDT